jgi:hypothetical protein
VKKQEKSWRFAGQLFFVRLFGIGFLLVEVCFDLSDAGGFC